MWSCYNTIGSGDIELILVKVTVGVVVIVVFVVVGDVVVVEDGESGIAQTSMV